MRAESPAIAAAESAGLVVLVSVVVVAVSAVLSLPQLLRLRLSAKAVARGKNGFFMKKEIKKGVGMNA